MYGVIECSYWATVEGGTSINSRERWFIGDELGRAAQWTRANTRQNKSRVFARVHFFVYVSDVLGGRNVVFVSETARMYVVQRFS